MTLAMEDVAVIKLGGTSVAGEAALLADVAAVARSRPVVVVHGGGVRLTEWLDRLNVETRFERGLRVTDERTVEVATAVLAGLLNTEIVAHLRTHGLDAAGLSGVDGGLLQGERVPGLGRVVHVTEVRRELLARLLEGGIVPVVAPIGLDQEGIICNVNADDAAAGLAAGLGARRLVLLTDVDGVRGDAGERMSTLTADEARALIDRGVIVGGMLPKVRAALTALTWEGAEAVIADGMAPRAVQRALDEEDFGTRFRLAGRQAGE